jgi:hypothetical protein
MSTATQKFHGKHEDKKNNKEDGKQSQKKNRKGEKRGNFAVSHTIERSELLLY